MVAVCFLDSEVARVEVVHPDFVEVMAVAEHPGWAVYAPENIEAVDIQAEQVQQAQPEIAALSGQDYPVRIASHSRAVVLMAPAVARAVAVLRLPLYYSIC